MSRLYTLLLFPVLFLMTCHSALAATNYNLIPKPAEQEKIDGNPFLLNSYTQIYSNSQTPEVESIIDLFINYVAEQTGILLRQSQEKIDKNVIVLDINTQSIPEEGYELEVQEHTVSIKASSGSGLFYGVQVFRKLLEIKPDSRYCISPLLIKDEPRFAYRGMMLDVSRNFKSLKFIKRYIDLLALHQMNKLHLHLSDDQGWRVEIKKYPKLTQVGAYRRETVKGFLTNESDSTFHGGYYTQEELKELVKYAKKRFIDIIPEIDMPGHMSAALAAYPELGCTGGPYEVSTRWGIHKDVLCLGSDYIWEFLEDVIKEVLDIFPSKYIHIGGDECPKTRWEQCYKCQTKIKGLGLTDNAKFTKESQLQSYLTHWVEELLLREGRNLAGWDEIIEGGLAPTATVYSWRGEEGGVYAAKKGQDVVLCPNNTFYFDYYQTVNTSTEPEAFPGVNTLEEVYNYSLVPSQLNDDEKEHILGAQGNLWCELISSEEHAEYMTLPRLAALSENLWSTDHDKDYVDFLGRLRILISLYNKLGYNYSVAAYKPELEVNENKELKQLSIKLFSSDSASIYYTLDGSEPTINSLRYINPIVLSENTLLKARAIRGDDTDANLYQEYFSIHKGLFAPIHLETTISKYFNPPFGETILTDGRRGNDIHVFGKVKSWVGFGSDLSVCLDLGEIQDLSQVITGVLLVPNSQEVNYTIALSIDGEIFQEVYTQKHQIAAIGDLKAIFLQRHARYVKVKMSSSHNTHLVIDEIIIE